MEQRIDAIYARQSIDRLDSISTESQIEFCAYELRGGEYTAYIDKGFSGKNTSRPEFQAMLMDVRSGKIKRVVCYRLDRISRSVLDFATMMDEFQRHNVEFVSCSEKFDTSTPMGRAMLNICIVFAQLERETIQQRVTDAYRSRCLKGFYMGGRVPYGYRLIDHKIDGKRTSCYAVKADEAEVVQLMYSLYSQPQTSIGDVVRYLDDHHIVNPQAADQHWNKSRVSGILRNPIYVRADMDIYDFFQQQGAELHNSPQDFIGTNGCYLYSDKEGGRKGTHLEHHHIVLAPHEGLVSSDVWLRSRQKCLNNIQVAKPLKAKNSWLAGKIKCGKCGYALVVKKAKTKTGRYFICSRHLDSHGCEGIGGISAPEVEGLVLGAIKERLKDFQVLHGPQQIRDNPRIAEINIEIAQVERDISLLMEKLMQAGEALTRHINARIAELDSRLTELQSMKKALQDTELARSATVEEITDYMCHWEELTIPDKMTVVDALIIAIRATQTTLDIEWRI